MANGNGNSGGDGSATVTLRGHVLWAFVALLAGGLGTFGLGPHVVSAFGGQDVTNCSIAAVNASEALKKGMDVVMPLRQDVHDLSTRLDRVEANEWTVDRQHQWEQNLMQAQDRRDDQQERELESLRREVGGRPNR